MNKFINTLKSIDPIMAVFATLLFAVAFMLGQQTASREVKKHYIVDASEVEVVYHNPYKALTLDECVTDYECNIAQLLDDQANGRFVSTNDAIPVIEPVDCGVGDKECERANKLNAGKPAHYPAICEPYIFSNEQSESQNVHKQREERENA